MVQKLYKAVIIDRLRGNESDNLVGLSQNDWVLAVYLKKVSAVKFFHHPCLSY